MEQRAFKRRALALGARVEIEGQFQECIVSNVSEAGARVTLKHPTKLPERFSMSLTITSSVLRLCQLAWQEGSEAGVRFVSARRKAKTWL
jgi:hypothetical protein